MVAASSSPAALTLAEARSQPSRTRLLDRASDRAALSIRATRSPGSETLILTRGAGMRDILPLFLPKCPRPGLALGHGGRLRGTYPYPRTGRCLRSALPLGLASDAGADSSSRQVVAGVGGAGRDRTGDLVNAILLVSHRAKEQPSGRPWCASYTLSPRSAGRPIVSPGHGEGERRSLVHPRLGPDRRTGSWWRVCGTSGRRLVVQRRVDRN